MDVKLPPLGEGADSGTVVGIMVSEGDQIKKGQILLELETGKAVAPIPAPASGKVAKLNVAVGATLTVGQSILTLAPEGDAEEKTEKPAAKPAKAKAAPSEEEAEAGEKEESEEPPAEAEAEDEESPAEGAPPPPASPSIRKIARELGIDLHKIRGSEHGGRIVMADLRGYIQRLQKLSAKPKAAPAPGAKPKPAPEQIDFSKWGAISKRPMTQLRKVIAQRMTENWNAIPHVTQFDDIDLTRVMELRKQYNEAYEKQDAKLTVTGFALKAVVNTLKKHPLFNSSLDEAAEEIVLKEYFHIGIAVDTEQGLIVPIIRDVDKKDLLTLSRELNELAAKTRDRKVSMEELQGGTFSISNQGALGGAHFTPIVNKPEVAILGMGKGAMKPIVTKDKKIEARLILPITLSYDHRVIDGAAAARFIVDLVEAFENFKEEDVKI